jgi:hypothetical protein
MVMVSARLTRRWRLSYRHDLTNAALAAPRVDGLANLPGERRSRGRCSTVPAASFNEGFYKVALICVFEARLHRATS